MARISIAVSLLAGFCDAIGDTGAKDEPPPEYPIPSNCNFVAASTTSPQLRYVRHASLQDFVF